MKRIASNIVVQRMTTSSDALAAQQSEAWTMDQERGWRRVVTAYSGVHGLSGQESRLLLGAVQGTADKLIASEWGCSRATVSTYWKRIFAKTGMRPQREVLAHLVRFAGAMVPTLEEEQRNAGVRSVSAMTPPWPLTSSWRTSARPTKQ